MEMRVYAVKDELTGEFMQPMFIQSDEVAKRMFNEIINTTDIIKNNPSEFTLHRLADYDTETGVFFYGPEYKTDHCTEKIGTAAQIKAERGETNGL